MMTTVCLNPSFDKTATVKQLGVGEVNRLSDVRYDAGGKGINVAIVLKRLKVDAQCIGCVGSSDETAFREMLDKEHVDFEALRLQGKVRTNLKICDEKTGVTTEFNEPGPAISADEIEAFLQLLTSGAKQSDYVVLSGSVPVGCGEDIYLRCMQALPDGRCIVDAGGAMLTNCLPAKPFLIKPNLPELEGIMQSSLRTIRSIRDAALTLRRRGAEHVVVSMGRYGAIYVGADKTLFSPALQVEAKSPVGAGDAMIGGMLMGLDRGMGMEEAFRCGVAAGAASVMTEGTQLIEVADFERLLGKVTLQEV